ncbi:MAG: DUF4102 domain-containing protein [Gammaproteobacteria bacterium]|nr:DUF4102 domain-containing protein [Gammaproteobacteria bacterium]
MAIRAFNARKTSYKVADGLGLHLLVRPSGRRLWRFRYRVTGKEKLAALTP